MKGKERSPVKKRSRIADDIRDRGGSKKMGALTATGNNNNNNNGNSSVKSGGGSTRRSLLAEKRDIRDLDGHVSGRAASHHAYANTTSASSTAAASSSSKLHGGGLEPMRPASRLPSGSSSSGSTESEYKTLRISELGSQLNDEEVEDGLFHEFKKFGDVSVKISRVNEERVAFVNFRRPDDAKAAKHARGKLVLYDRPLKIEAVYMNRRRSRSPVEKDTFAAAPGHRHLHPQRPISPTGLGYRDYRLQQLALGRLPPPPPPPLPRDMEREREFSIFDARGRPPFIPECAAFRDEDLISPEDDQRANRTLFLGNLDIAVTDSDLRRAFDRFGVITEVDIKRPVRGQNSTYGFLKFENLDMAHRAKMTMSGKVVCHKPIKIGYGKATPSTRLWVGGLGPWVPLAGLAREFDRFGTIRTIDYRKGDAWAYIQYESLDAAQAACTHMRGFPLGGPDRRLRVDFGDTEHRYQQQQQPSYLQSLPLPPHYDLVPEAFVHRLAPEGLRVRERSPPPPQLRFRERDLYPAGEWASPGVRERGRGGPPFEPLDHLERRPRDAWSLERERELQGRDPMRKRRLDRSPDSSEHAAAAARRRHGGGGNNNSPGDRSPGGSSRDGGRHSDSERPGLPPPPQTRSDRPSPLGRDRRASLDRGPPEKRPRALSPSVEPERERRRKAAGGGGAGDSCKSPAKREDRSEHPSSSSSRSNPQSKQGPGGHKLSQAWQGVLLLKNSSFPTSMHLLEGDLGVATGLLVEGAARGPVSQLKITQRLRLDQPKLDEVSRRIKAAGPGGHAVLLAVPGSSEEGPQDVGSSTERPLKNLVSYLKQKQAAGVISLPVGGGGGGSRGDKDHAGVLHAFPPCEFSQQFLDASSKAFAKTEEDYLVMIVVRGTS